jgi:integrase
LNALREWKLVCPRRDTGRKDSRGRPIEELHFVFPNGNGHIESHSNVVQRGLAPTLIAAGVTVAVKDDDGKPMRDDEGKPMHALRHFYASWCINRRADGGLELPLKVVQERLGHATIVMTADRYGHLFARADDSLSAGESLLLG